ncbi:MAG: RNA polymerase sigma factor [Sandaracinaceae bacterium]|nr:RNA polymerase sigma factor [Sandaracinaceae bacterium]
MSPLTHDPATDERLLAAFLGGDAQAFEEIVHRYRGPLYNFLLRSVRDPQVAADLLQEVFLRVIQRADKFHGAAKFSTWVYTIARNLTIDHARRMQHRRHRSLDAPVEIDGDGRSTLGERVSGTDLGGERAVDSLAIQRRVASAVEALPSEQREVFLMRQLQGLPFQDIADVVGVPVNTVKSRMRYALERLQEALSEYEHHLEETR